MPEGILEIPTESTKIKNKIEKIFMAVNPLFDTNLMILQVALIVGVILYFNYKSWKIEKKGKKK